MALKQYFYEHTEKVVLEKANVAYWTSGAKVKYYIQNPFKFLVQSLNTKFLVIFRSTHKEL